METRKVNLKVDGRMKATNKWISIKDKKPTPLTEVLVVLDYRPWGHRRRVEIATPHYTHTRLAYGGPNALTGSGMLNGTYFSIPAIVHPDVVTHWMELPKLPEED